MNTRCRCCCDSPAGEKNRHVAHRAMTLVEVMVGAAIFTLLATGLTATYIQNMRMSKVISYRTQAINTAMSVLEQLRANGYPDLLELYYQPEEPPPLIVKIIDPTQKTTIPTGYRDLSVPINLRDSDTLTETWTELELPMSDAVNAARLPMRFWVALRHNAQATGKVRAVLELSLFYQWHSPADPDGTWQTDSLAMVVPKLTPGTDEI